MKQGIISPPGRINFLKTLQASIERSPQGRSVLGLLVVHVRQMRQINISAGYHNGELLITHLAQKIGHILREADGFYRIGNAEFSLILPGLVNSAHTELAAARIADLCNQPFRAGEHMIRVQVGIGVALYPAHGKTPEGLLCCAEIALLQSYQNSTGYSLYSAPADSVNNVASSHTLSSALAGAIERRELEIYVQPKIHLKTLHLAGVEALLRWTRDDGQAVVPSVFIPIAEQSNLILPITLWCLHTALRQCAKYFDTYAGFSVAVNLSPIVLAEPDIFELIMGVANIWCSGRQQLTLEITESLFMKDPEMGIRILNQFHDEGVRLSIDDFGTGYSSLSQISRLPVSELKIDKSFVLGVTTSKRQKQIVRAIIDLAHNFKMTVVAEGIEDAETFAYLEKSGCDYGQGYYIARPMALNEFERWLGSRGPSSSSTRQVNDIR